MEAIYKYIAPGPSHDIYIPKLIILLNNFLKIFKKSYHTSLLKFS